MLHVRIMYTYFRGERLFTNPSPLVMQATPCETDTKSDVQYRNQNLSLSDSLGYSIL